MSLPDRVRADLFSHERAPEPWEAAAAGAQWPDAMYAQHESALVSLVASDPRTSYLAGEKWQDPRFWPHADAFVDSVAQDPEYGNYACVLWPENRFAFGDDRLVASVARSPKESADLFKNQRFRNRDVVRERHRMLRIDAICRDATIAYEITMRMDFDQVAPYIPRLAQGMARNPTTLAKAFMVTDNEQILYSLRPYIIQENFGSAYLAFIDKTLPFDGLRDYTFLTANYISPAFFRLSTDEFQQIRRALALASQVHEDSTFCTALHRSLDDGTLRQWLDAIFDAFARQEHHDEVERVLEGIR